MSKFITSCLIGLALSAVAHQAQASKIPGHVAIHIAQVHYDHPVRMLHPYLDYWHTKGPVAERAVTSSLATHFDNAQMCVSSDDANVVLTLDPYMFYNAQLRVFHAEFTARAFTDSTVPVLTIKKQAQILGDLGIQPEFSMEKAYAKALEQVFTELEKDPTFVALLGKTPQKNVRQLCKSIDYMPLPRFYY